VALLFVCSPGNPTGAVLSLTDWEHLFALSERYNFVIAADECYSEIYHGDRRWARWKPPTAGPATIERPYARLMVFSSLSKRSNVPGMRSGFVAGDAEVLKKFLLYRTYHGGAMSLAVQAASIAAGTTKPMSNKPRTVPRQVQRHHAAAEGSAGRGTAGRRFLPVGRRQPHRPVRHRIRPAPVRRI
jgi:aspartate/methionine/tyrosine aminotransferase